MRREVGIHEGTVETHRRFSHSGGGWQKEASDRKGHPRAALHHGRDQQGRKGLHDDREFPLKRLPEA